MLAIVDCGIGNVSNVINAFNYIGVKCILTRDPFELSSARGLVLPGVGAFGECVTRLEYHNLTATLASLVSTGMPLLGICLGFQLLMRSSTEMGYHLGLDLVSSEVIQLPVTAPIPHVGWAQVKLQPHQESESLLMAGLNKEYFYFVHSYGAIKPPAGAISAFTSYSGCDFVSMIEFKNIFGTQFHPEKSGEPGLQLLNNFWGVC